MAEAYFATLEGDWLNRQRFRSQAEPRMAVFQLIEGFYNPSRRPGIGCLSSIIFERINMPESNSTEPFNLCCPHMPQIPVRGHSNRGAD